MARCQPFQSSRTEDRGSCRSITYLARRQSPLAAAPVRKDNEELQKCIVWHARTRMVFPGKASPNVQDPVHPRLLEAIHAVSQLRLISPASLQEDGSESALNLSTTCLWVAGDEVGAPAEASQGRQELSSLVSFIDRCALICRLGAAVRLHCGPSPHRGGVRSALAE